MLASMFQVCDSSTLTVVSWERNGSMVYPCAGYLAGEMRELLRKMKMKMSFRVNPRSTILLSSRSLTVRAPLIVNIK